MISALSLDINLTQNMMMFKTLKNNYLDVHDLNVGVYDLNFASNGNDK